jgi:hypothetical protein
MVLEEIQVEVQRWKNGIRVDPNCPMARFIHCRPVDSI